MAKKYSVRWSVNAKNTYLDSISLILQKWTIKEVKHFETLVNDLLTRLESNKNLCPKSKQFKLRKCVLSKQTSLIYQSNYKTIDLIAFIDNRSSHSY